MENSLAEEKAVKQARSLIRNVIRRQRVHINQTDGSWNHRESLMQKLYERHVNQSYDALCFGRDIVLLILRTVPDWLCERR